MTAHVALTVQRDMRQIADLWPDLEARLTGSGTSDRSGVRRPPGSKPPIDVHIADVTAEVSAWVVFLARVLIDETDWTPRSHDTAAILRDIADNRVGHFTEAEDQGLREAVTEDAARLARLVHNTARPSDRRTIPLGIPCMEHSTSELGERVICTGQYATTLTPGERIGDFVCSKDREHRITPLEWQRSQRHDPAKARDMDALVFGPRMAWQSDRDVA
jgi:hypothetical protein